MAEWYKEELKGTPYDYHHEIGDVRHSYWMFSILVGEQEDRDKVREKLATAGIETRPLFYPVHTMPMYATKYQRHEVAENLGWRGINLPSFPMLTREQVQYITNSLKAGT